MGILQACPVDALLVFVTEERDTFEGLEHVSRGYPE